MRASVTACVALAPRFAPLPSRRRVPRKPQPGSYTQWRVAASLDGPELPSEVEAKRLQLQKKRRYINITGFPFPLTPLLSRVTVCQELVSGKVWTFEQEQGIGLGLGVSTSVVMTVVKLKDGTLWVHNPIAPTEEMLDLLRSRCGGDDVNAAGDKGTASNKKYITVKYIVLATTQYEHKIFVGPFSRRFPRAQVWVAPGQFSFPVNLPNAFFGIFPTGVLSVDGVGMPWRDEIHQKLLILPPLFWNQYTFCECAFLHRDTGTLLVTDAAVFVDETHPEVIPSETLVDLGDEYGFTISLLRFGNYRNARSLPGAGDFSRFTDTERTQKTGWYRMVRIARFQSAFPKSRRTVCPYKIDTFRAQSQGAVFFVHRARREKYISSGEILPRLAE
jgi:hypothetical protein